MITVLWLAIHLPWEIAFPEDAIIIQNYIILVIFIFDIIINLRTSYFDEENDEIVDA